MRFVGLRLPKNEKAGFVCPECGATFKTEAALKKHVAKDHPVVEGTGEDKEADNADD